MRFAWLLALALVACGEPKPIAANYPDMQSEGFHVFSKNCSTCHAPPQPTKHTATAWPGVIERMQSHREQGGLGRIMATDKVKILDYLVRHARPEGGA